MLPGRKGYVHVARGKVSVNGHALRAGTRMKTDSCHPIGCWRRVPRPPRECLVIRSNPREIEKSSSWKSIPEFPPEQRGAIVQALSKLLADTYVLYLKTHSFHWNVEGPMFQTLHQMFMEQYTETWNAIDLIAERIRSLGEYAPGTYHEYARLTRIKDTEGVPRAEEMVRLLVEGQEAVVRTAREALSVADEANDQPTLDLLTQRMQVHEKNAWMLRSLLKK